MALPVVLLVLSTAIVALAVAMIIRREAARAAFISGAVTNGLLATWVFFFVFLSRDGLPAIIALVAAANLSAATVIAIGGGVRARRPNASNADGGVEGIGRVTMRRE